MFLNVGTAEKEEWKRIKKSTSLTLSMNPETEDVDYIADENPTTELKSYKPSIDQDLAMIKGQEDFEYIWKKFFSMDVGTDAITDVMVVFMFDGDVTAGFKAWKTSSILSMQDMDAVGSKINFQIMFGGTIEKGLATMADGVPTWKAAPAPTKL